MTKTNTTRGARDHARAQAGVRITTMPTVPASSFPSPPPGVDRAALTWAETVAGGGYASRVISRGTTLRLTDLEGEACAHLLLYNADQPWERLNIADTVKVPWQVYLTTGHPLLSDQGRALATIVGDTAAANHDALCGAAPAAVHEQRHGDGSAYGPTPAARELLKLAAAKHALEPRDIPPSPSFFKRVRVQDNGDLRLDVDAQPGGHVEIKAELPLIVLVANAPHRLDERAAYTCTPLQILAWRGTPTQPRDPLWSSTPELERALWNTHEYVYAREVQPA
jgi:urea carboxylase-associated protein 2